MTAQETIKQTIEELLMLLDFVGTVSVEQQESDDEKKIVCNISAEKDSHFLIGQRGGNLQALQAIARAVVRKKTKEHVSFFVDINSYHREKVELLKRMAKEAGAQAHLEKKPIVLRPMSAYERRIVHMTLSDDEKVATESIGEGTERKVVVKAQGVLDTEKF